MVQLGREISFNYVQTKPSSSRRGFCFYLAAQFAKEVDPLSGMTVNLVEVDRWLADFQSTLAMASSSASASPSFEVSDFHPAPAILRQAHDFLQVKAASAGAQLTLLRLREERQACWEWDLQLPPNKYRQTTLHFLESFHADSAGLCKISLSWELFHRSESRNKSKIERAEFDALSESLIILKSAGLQSTQSVEENASQLRPLLRSSHTEESVLAKIDIEVKNGRYVYHV